MKVTFEVDEALLAKAGQLNPRSLVAGSSQRAAAEVVHRMLDGLAERRFVDAVESYVGGGK